jgi:hypothetical protein
MNFYASRDFLDAAAAVYFKGRDWTIEDVEIGGEILRLLVVDGRPVTKMQFLDFHQPLSTDEVHEPVRRGRYAQHIVRDVLTRLEWEALKKCPELAPFVDWSWFRSFDDYKAQLVKRHKSLVRDRERRWRSLCTAYGEPVFTMDDRGADVLPTAREWKSQQLLDTGHPNWIALPKTMEFLETLRARNLLVSSTLRAGGRLVSVWLGFVHEGTWSGWVFAYDPAFRKYSVGHQLVNCMLEESFRLGHREFDFSEGAEDYKLLYATHARVLGDLGRAPPGRAVIVYAKAVLGRSPKLLRAMQDAKRALTGWLRPRRPLMKGVS